MSNEVLENIKSRRSVRTYTERQVSAGDLNLILEAAAYAPSGMNFQTWHFTAIQNAAVQTELNEKIKGAFAKSDDPHLQERGHSETYCLLLPCSDAGHRLQRAYPLVGAYGLRMRLAEYFPCRQVFGHRLLLD